MEELKRLIKINIKNGGKTFPIINQQDENSLETKLFSLIKSGQAETDEEAAEALYGQKKITPNYRMLKSRVRRKLLNQLHFLDFSDDTHRASIKEFKECLTLILEANILVLHDEHPIADKLLDQVLANAKNNALHDIVVKALELKQTTLLSKINKRAFYENLEELKKYSVLVSKEQEASIIYNQAKIELKGDVKSRNRYLPVVPEAIANLASLWQETKSPKVYNYFNLLSIFYLELIGDYGKIYEIVRQAEELLGNGELNEKWFNHDFNKFIRVYALLRTNQLDLGLELAKEYKNSFSQSSFNWFAFMENYVLLALHKQDYIVATELMNQVLENTKHVKLSDVVIERWYLYHEYLLLFTDKDEQQKSSMSSLSSTTRFAVLSKDKEGFNLALIVLFYMQDFLKGKADDSEFYTERLKKYKNKYLRKSYHERSRLFVTLLLLALRYSKNKKTLLEKSKEHFYKLSITPVPGDAFAEVEIIPYEHLWELLLQGLPLRE